VPVKLCPPSLQESNGNVGASSEKALRWPARPGPFCALIQAGIGDVCLHMEELSRNDCPAKNVITKAYYSMSLL